MKTWNVLGPDPVFRKYTGSGWTPWQQRGPAAGTNGEMLSRSNMPLRLGRGDDGGVFFLRKTERNYAMGRTTTSAFDGNFLVIAPRDNRLAWTYDVKSDEDIDDEGNTAVARTEPTNPESSVSTFVGELRERLPTPTGFSTWAERTRITRELSRSEKIRLGGKAVGNEYLNLVFGWLPLLSEVRNMAQAVIDADDIISQYRRDSGQKVRRRYVSSDTSQSYSFTGDMIPYPSDLNVFPRGTYVETKSNKTWFSGAFRYYIPMSSDLSSRLSRYRSYANKLFGVELTPEVLWDLTPWSWAIDWYADIGDTLHNVSALGRDGLVLEYGYMMASSEVTRSMMGIVPSAYFVKGYGENSMAQTEMTYAVKQRRQASPYGFGVDLASLTASQAAVVASLGLSRLG